MELAKSSERLSPFLRFGLSWLPTYRWHWHAHDVYTLGLLCVYSACAIALYPWVEHASLWLLLNALIAMLIVLLAWADRTGAPPWIQLLHWFYLPPVIYLMYQQVHAYVPVVNPHLYDELLIAWDYALFNTHPTHWLARFANPVLTEYLQTAYMLFYFLPLLHGVELLTSRRFQQVQKLARSMSFGFYFSYLCYFALPAIGPRFTLHDFSQLDEELPGLWLTPTWRQYVNAGGGIPEGSPNPEQHVHRDCMPSGHTMMTLVNLILAFRFRSRTRRLLAVIGGSLIVATVYLRYHYAVDVLAGALCALFVLWLEPRIYRWLVQRGWVREKLYARLESRAV
ncbi:MAG: phosphatase PAP2 family protein [Candidatus Kapabacteria bacterium]|nr:phosphatase PAP2 family protein [Candidatus Kapabacteria bacterium]MDW8011603.1 phosphatase PAP2 family protein [Bacteroidota bacterium]